MFIFRNKISELIKVSEVINCITNRKDKLSTAGYLQLTGFSISVHMHSISKLDAAKNISMAVPMEEALHHGRL